MSFGVTGPRKTLGPEALESLKRVISINKNRTPVSAGFGVSTPDHVRTLMRAGADGAIVGSALVQKVQDHLGDPGETEQVLKKHVAELKQATRKFWLRLAGGLVGPALEQCGYSSVPRKASPIVPL